MMRPRRAAARSTRPAAPSTLPGLRPAALRRRRRRLCGAGLPRRVPCRAGAAAPRRGLRARVRAGLAAFAIALVGGWIGTQYVRNMGFSLIAPGLVGVAVALAATAAAATPRVA